MKTIASVKRENGRDLLKLDKSNQLHFVEERIALDDHITLTVPRGYNGTLKQFIAAHRPERRSNVIVKREISPQEAAAWLALNQRFSPAWKRLLRRIFPW